MKIFLSIVFISILGFVQAQSESSKILWKPESRLTWEDFQGVPHENTSFHANTNSGIFYSWGLKGTSERMELNYNVETFFYPEQSWVQAGSKNAHLLKHEQLHFDISELQARKLRKLLANVDSSKLNKDSKDYLNKLYEKIDKERGAMQNAFDKESDHSTNVAAENKWQQFIEQELNKFEAYIY